MSTFEVGVEEEDNDDNSLEAGRENQTHQKMADSCEEAEPCRADNAMRMSDSLSIFYESLRDGYFGGFLYKKRSPRHPPETS